MIRQKAGSLQYCEEVEVLEVVEVREFDVEAHKIKLQKEEKEQEKTEEEIALLAQYEKLKLRFGGG